MAAFLAMFGTVYFGAHNRADQPLTRLTTALASRSGLAPVIEASQCRVERGQGYVTVTGMASNLTDKRIKNVEALVEFTDKDGSLLKAESALIDLSTLQGREESPFTVQTRDVPGMASYRVRFRELVGGSIPSSDR